MCRAEKQHSKGACKETAGSRGASDGERFREREREAHKLETIAVTTWRSASGLGGNHDTTDKVKQ